MYDKQHRKNGRFINKFLLGCLLSGLAFNAYCAHYPTANNVPGGIVKIDIPGNGSKPPALFFQDKPLLVIKNADETGWRTYVGVPLELKHGAYHLEMRDRSKKISFEIKQKKYRTEWIQIKDKTKVFPDEKALKRIAKEIKKLNKLYKHHSEIDPFANPYKMPVEGRLTSAFGKKRIFNGKVKERHLAVNIRAKSGTEIRPCAPGIVLATEDLFYLGKTVFVDHGKGIISLYAHLDEVKVRPGRHLSGNSILGTVGRTGRATGPHLYWGMVMNQTPVDPILFVK